MPNIRIKDIPTTASATSSTDFIGIDGSANGTRKLNAYSPTFGGNLTVSGTGTLGGALTVQGAAASNFASRVDINRSANTSDPYTHIGLTRGSGAGNTSAIVTTGDGANGVASTSIQIAEVDRLKVTTTATTLGGNLTVSGTGTSSFAGNVAVANTLSAKDTNAALTLQAGPGTGGINYGFGQGSGAHVWYNGTDEKMRLSAAGNLGIGTTSPDAKLNVVGSTNGGVGNVYLYDNAANAAGIGGGIAFGGIFTGSTSTPWAIIKGIKDNGDDGNFAGGMVFKTRTASAFGEAMRLTSGGNLLLGTTTDGGQKLQVSGTAYVSGDATFAGSVTATTSSASGVESGFSNTAVNTAAYSLFSIKTASGGGDPYLLFYNVGVEAWSIGMDVSDSNSWKLSRSTSVGSNDRLTITTAGNATFAGSIAINNTVQTAASVASTHKVTISIGGSTYYLLATNV